MASEQVIAPKYLIVEGATVATFFGADPVRAALDRGALAFEAVTATGVLNYNPITTDDLPDGDGY